MTTYYIDDSRGNDGWNGQAQTDQGGGVGPWKTPAMIATVVAGPGDQFLLASDSVWRPAHNTRCVPPATWTGTKKSPVIIGAYDPPGVAPGGKPTVVWNRETVAGDWTEVPASPGCWLYANAGAYLFTNSCLLRINDTWDASCVDLTGTDAQKAAAVAASGVPGRYFASGTNLWLYSPPGVNPITQYGKVVVSPAASGYFTFSSGRKWITIQDVHFEDTACGVLCYSGSSAEVGFRVRRISGRRVSNLIGANADAGGALRAWIHDCVIEDFGPLAIISAVNGDGIRQLEIYNNRIDDGVHCWAQGAIYLTCRAAAFAPKVYGNHVSRCRWGTRDKSVDGSCIYMETKSDAALVFDNLLTDSYCAIQVNAGRKAVVTGNTVLRCRLAVRLTDQEGVGACDYQFYNNTFLVGDLDQARTQWGGAQGEQYTGFWMYRPSGQFKLTARNNIICDVTGTNPCAAFGLPDSSPIADLGTEVIVDGNWIFGYAFDVQEANNVNNTATTTKLGTADPRPLLEASGALKAPHLLDGAPAVNPLARVGTYIPGVRLKGGRRITAGRVPAGAAAESSYAL